MHLSMILNHDKPNEKPHQSSGIKTKHVISGCLNAYWSMRIQEWIEMLQQNMKEYAHKHHDSWAPFDKRARQNNSNKQWQKNLTCDGVPFSFSCDTEAWGLFLPRVPGDWTTELPALRSACGVVLGWCAFVFEHLRAWPALGQLPTFEDDGCAKDVVWKVFSLFLVSYVRLPGGPQSMSMALLEPKDCLRRGTAPPCIESQQNIRA